ncbi:MAG: HIT domain-containing protein [Thermoguttaceae bacterium]|nr:HIT domain-containing protein [Thermoguttaceae bacterium]
MNNDVLWAPWRMAYNKSDAKEEPRKVEVAQGGDPNCFICQAVADSTEYDRERLVVGRTESTVAILNRFPYNNGHLLIAPKRHIARMELLTPEESRDIMAELSYWVGAIEKAMNAEGFNVGLNLGRVAGAGLPGHMHWHIVPRWNGDASFITTIGSAKAIPQALEAAWELLRRE